MSTNTLQNYPPRTIPLANGGKLILSINGYGGIKAERFNANGVWCATGAGLTLRDAILGCFQKQIRGRDGKPWTTFEENKSEMVEQLVHYIEATKGGRNGA